MKWKSKYLRKKEEVEKYRGKIKIVKKFLFIPKKVSDEWRWLGFETIVYYFDYYGLRGRWAVCSWFDIIEKEVMDSYSKERKIYYKGIERSYGIDDIVEMPKSIRKKFEKIERETNNIYNKKQELTATLSKDCLLNKNTKADIFRKIVKILDNI